MFTGLFISDLFENFYKSSLPFLNSQEVNNCLKKSNTKTCRRKKLYTTVKSSKYIPRTIYLDKKNVEKLDDLVQYTGLNYSQIFRQILPMIKKEEIETEEEKFKRLSKSGRGKLINKPSEHDNIHIDDLIGIITDGKPADSVEAVRQIREEDY